jgi:hypothetical protein
MALESVSVLPLVLPLVLVWAGMLVVLVLLVKVGVLVHR